MMWSAGIGEVLNRLCLVVDACLERAIGDRCTCFIRVRVGPPLY